MARRKIKLARILNEYKRRATIKKRKEALIKSLQTICVLCGTEACMVIYDHTNNQATNNTMVWPSRQEALAMMSSLASLPEDQRNKKTVTHEMFLHSLLVKEKKRLEVVRNKNNQMEMEEILHKFAIDPTSIEPASGKLTRLFLYINELIEKIGENEIVSQCAASVNIV